MSRSRWRNELKAEGADEEEKSVVVEMESNEVNCREAAREEEKKGDGERRRRGRREKVEMGRDAIWAAITETEGRTRLGIVICTRNAHGPVSLKELCKLQELLLK